MTKLFHCVQGYLRTWLNCVSPRLINSWPDDDSSRSVGQSIYVWGVNKWGERKEGEKGCLYELSEPQNDKTNLYEKKGH